MNFLATICSLKIKGAAGTKKEENDKKQHLAEQLLAQVHRLERLSPAGLSAWLVVQHIDSRMLIAASSSLIDTLSQNRSMNKLQDA